jgi:hypothetical protein
LSPSHLESQAARESPTIVFDLQVAIDRHEIGSHCTCAGVAFLLVLAEPWRPQGSINNWKTMRKQRVGGRYVRMDQKKKREWPRGPNELPDEKNRIDE